MKTNICGSLNQSQPYIPGNGCVRYFACKPNMFPLYVSNCCFMCYLKLEKAQFSIQPSEFIELLSQQLPHFREQPLSAINFQFEEKYGPSFCITDSTWTLFEEFLTYHSVPNISIKAARHIKATEELLICYEKPPPDFLRMLRFLILYI